MTTKAINHLLCKKTISNRQKKHISKMEKETVILRHTCISFKKRSIQINKIVDFLPIWLP